MLASRDCKNLVSNKCHDMAPESTSGAENTTNMNSKTSPMQLEGPRGPNSDPKIRRASRRV
jgi:hypothetical protein